MGKRLAYALLISLVAVAVCIGTKALPGDSDVIGKCSFGSKINNLDGLQSVTHKNSRILW